MDTTKALLVPNRDVEKNAYLYPHKTALIYKDTRMPYEALLEKTETLASSLIDMGLKKGARVGLLMPKRPEVSISFWAQPPPAVLLSPSIIIRPWSISAIY